MPESASSGSILPLSLFGEDLDIYILYLVSIIHLLAFTSLLPLALHTTAFLSIGLLANPKPTSGLKLIPRYECHDVPNQSLGCVLSPADSTSIPSEASRQPIHVCNGFPRAIEQSNPKSNIKELQILQAPGKRFGPDLATNTRSHGRGE